MWAALNNVPGKMWLNRCILPSRPLFKPVHPCLENPIEWTERSETALYIIGERARVWALRRWTSGGTMPGLSSELWNLDKE